jgi:ABC-2 type transport system ATP-binding protein
MRLKLGMLLAFIRPFKVLLLDEPTSALDPESGLLLERKLLDLRERGKAVILTSHDPDMAAHLGAKRWRMESGLLVDKDDRVNSQLSR